jgi:hypothetical protein
VVRSTVWRRQQRLDQAYSVIVLGPDGHLASAKCEQLEMKYRMRCAGPNFEFDIVPTSISLVRICAYLGTPDTQNW